MEACHTIGWIIKLLFIVFLCVALITHLFLSDSLLFFSFRQFHIWFREQQGGANAPRGWGPLLLREQSFSLGQPGATWGQPGSASRVL